MESFFTEDEMKCPCCGKMMMDQTFMKKLNVARFMAGFPFVVSSGYRCPAHNEEVGSTSTNHTTGQAADVRCVNDAERYNMIWAMIGAGIKGIGVGKGFVHGDINRSIPKLWTY